MDLEVCLLRKHERAKDQEIIRDERRLPDGRSGSMDRLDQRHQDEHDGKGSDIEIPDPDYDDEYLSKPPLVRSQSSPHRSREGLIEPKKLFNPCIESKKVQNVHREMMMNKKLGKDVLHQKSELKQELERRKELQKKKELEEQYKKKRTSFEVKIAEQANKLESVEKQQSKTLPEEDDQQPEFYRVHSKISKSHNQT